MRKHRRPSQKIWKIGLLLSEKAEYGRGVLRGIANFAKDHPHWHFRVESPDGVGLRELKQWQPDGLIVMLNRKELVPKLLAFRGPIVNVCKLPGTTNTLLVQSDDVMVGRLGAEHLLERGAAIYGYVGLSQGEWVEVRGKAFAETIKKTGASCLLFHPMGREASRADQASLRKWLQKCPKPLAIMAGNDHRGRLVLETTHGQFRHMSLTDAGTLLVAHMDSDKVSEYDVDGKEIWSVAVPGPWSATRLKNGDTLIVSNTKFVREVDPAGKTIWEITPADVPDYKVYAFQTATRLSNGNTLINNWTNQWHDKIDPTDTPVQAWEIAPDKKVVWALRSWTDPANLGPATTIQLLDEPGAPELAHFGNIK